MAKPAARMTITLAACLAAALPAGLAARPGAPAKGTMVLAGEIRAEGAPAGTLALYLDGELHGQVPAGAGTFEITLPRDGSAGMVSLEFAAPDLRLRSLLGGQARLSKRAGGDARLVVAEEDGLRLSALGSAMAVLATRTGAGAPATDVALARAVNAIEGWQLLSATAVLARLAAEPALLPPGFDDGLALLEDAEAFADFVQAHPAILDAAAEVLDALPVAPLPPDGGGPVLVFTGARRAPGDPLHGPGLVVEREGAGYRVHDDYFDGPAYSGAVDAAGTLRLVPHSPVARVNFHGPACPSQGGKPTWEVANLVQRDFRRHWRGSGVSLWQLGQDYVLSYPQCPELAPREVRTASLRAAPDMVRARLLTTPRRFTGRQSLPLFCPLLLPHGDLAFEPCGQVDHVFAPDGSGVADPQGKAPQPFAWSIDAHGAMRVDYGDRASRFWILDPGDRVVQPLAWVAEGEVVGYTGTSSGQGTRVVGGLSAAGDARVAAD